MTAALAEPVETLTVPDDDAVHLVCCNTDAALCGVDLSGGEWMPTSGGTDCILCRTILLSTAACRSEYCPGWSA